MEQGNLIQLIEKRKTQLLDHIIRHNSLIKNTLEVKIMGKKGMGRRRKEIIREVMQITGWESYQEMKQEDWLQ